jgi:hypothetical protein
MTPLPKQESGESDGDLPLRSPAGLSTMIAPPDAHHRTDQPIFRTVS